MKVYAQATDKTTSTGKTIYHVIDMWEARDRGIECNFELADTSDLVEKTPEIFDSFFCWKMFLVVNDDGMIDIDRTAYRLYCAPTDEDFSDLSPVEAVLTREMIAAAIRRHGAKAVYQAATRHMSDSKSLHAVGLIPGNLGDVWCAQSEAYAAMSEADKAIDHADAQARLDELGHD